MIIHRAHVYRLYPTDEQEETLSQWIGAVRFTYNIALEQRRDWYRPGRTFTYPGQCRELTALRSEVEWLCNAPSQPLQQALKDLDRAYVNWWKGRANAPKPRKRGQNDSMRFPDKASFDLRRISRHWGEVKLPKLGWVRLRWDREIPGAVKNITIARKAGLWTVSCQYVRETVDPAASLLPAVGIDRGVVVFAALSSGAQIAPADYGKKARKALARAQRKLSRKRKGSNNRRKQVRRVARLHARVARARKDFLHKASHNVAQNHGTVVLEKLEVANMVRSAAGTLENPGRNVRQKSGLNRAILDQGWHAFRVLLDYKLRERGGRLIEVPAAYTSLTCAVCGRIDANSRVSQSRFVCAACGNTTNADWNAAINILRRADSPVLPVEASRLRAREAGTRRSDA